MLSISFMGMVSIVIGVIIVIICCIGIIIASIFQNKQEKRYNDCLNIIKEKGNNAINVRDGLDQLQINSIDSSINVNELMKQLYDTFLELQNKVKELDNNFDNILTGFIKDIYKNKIDTFKMTNRSEILDGIELVGYSITEFKPDKLKFRLNINCFNYKKDGETITGGSNLEKIEQILIINYEKIDDKWLISDIETVYQMKLNK